MSSNRSSIRALTTAKRLPLTRRLLRIAWLAGWALLALTAVPAQETGDDPRLEAYQLPLDIRHLASVDLLVANPQDLSEVGPAFYELTVRPFDALHVNGPDLPLCPDETFYAQPVPQSNGRSAILVGDDLVLTAPHGSDPQTFCDDKLYILDYGLQSADDPLGDPVPPGGGTVLIERSKVFACAELVACGNPLFQVCSQAGTTGDWALLRLESAAGRIPLKIKRTEGVAVGDEAVIVGHPNRIPTKGELSAFTSSGPTGVTVPGSVAGGSSGCMMADRASRRAVGVAATGSTPTVFFEKENCYRQCFEPFCSNTLTGGTATWRFAEHVPQVGLEVTVDHPSDPIDHYGPPGGPFTHESVDMTLFVDLGETRSVDWSIPVLRHAIAAPGGDSNTPSSGTLTGLDNTITFPVELTTIAYWLGVGAYEQSVDVHDEVYRTVDPSRHRLFVGVDGFGLDPQEDFVGDGPGAPPGSIKSYALDNRWGIAQTVEVTGSDSWITLNGAPGSVEVVLPPEGSEDVVVGLDRSGLGTGVYAGTVEFTSSQAGEILHSEEIAVRMDVGREIFAYGGPPVEFNGNTVTLPISVVHNSFAPLYVRDVDVRLTWSGGPTSTAVAAESRVRSPKGTEVVLAETLGVSDQIYDDDTNPPLGSLAGFNGEPTDGTWELVIIAQPQARGTITGFEVRLHVGSGLPQ